MPGRAGSPRAVRVARRGGAQDRLRVRCAAHRGLAAGSGRPAGQPKGAWVQRCRVGDGSVRQGPAGRAGQAAVKSIRRGGAPSCLREVPSNPPPTKPQLGPIRARKVPPDVTQTGYRVRAGALLVWRRTALLTKGGNSVSEAMPRTGDKGVYRQWWTRGVSTSPPNARGASDHAASSRGHR